MKLYTVGIGIKPIRTYKIVKRIGILYNFLNKEEVII